MDICGRCGNEIPASNLPHVCDGLVPMPRFPASCPPWTLNRPADLRAAEALERCADALDRIAKTLEEG